MWPNLTLPDRPSDEVQYVRATIRRNVGALPHLTETAYSTWDKIVETVFLALLATVMGTALAIPLSFMAARNLMVSVRSPLASISLSLLGWPAGVAIGYLAARWVGTLGEPLASSFLANLAAGRRCAGHRLAGSALGLATGGAHPSRHRHSRGARSDHAAGGAAGDLSRCSSWQRWR